VADFTYNITKGRATELAHRVNTNDPANSALVVVAINTSDSDATLKDLDSLSAIIALAGTAEVTNTNYARKTLIDTGGITITYDDANDRVDIDIPDQTWSLVAVGDSWTDLIFCYDADTTVGTDADIIPLSQHDFAVTPDGTDVTAQIASGGFYRTA
jgi:hypothetical protein